MELNFKQMEMLLDDVVRRYGDYIIESNRMSEDQKVAVLETILSDLYSNIN